jgi:hypothetical protein
MLSSRSFHRLLVTVLVALAMGPLAGGAAVASTINWRIAMQAEGTVLGFPAGSPPFDITDPSTYAKTIPVGPGTPMTVDLSFDSGTPNVCPPGRGGVYLIGGASGNTAVMHFMGYDYSAFGGIETGVFGPCGAPAVFAGLRLFVSGGSQVDASGTLVQFVPTPGFGNFFIDLPRPADGVSLPIQLPTTPFPTGTEHFGDSNQLRLSSAEIRPVPEPGTFGLIALGGLLVGTRRRRSAATRCNERRAERCGERSRCSSRL